MKRRQVDLIGFSMTPRQIGGTPCLLCTLQIKNESDFDMVILSGICRLDLFDKTISYSPVLYDSPDSWRGANFTGTVDSSNVDLNDVTLIRKGIDKYVQAIFEISSAKLGWVIELIEKMPRESRRVDYRVLMELQVIMDNLTSTVVIGKGGSLSAHEWYDCLKAWGKQIEWIYLPVQLMNSLRELIQQIGVVDEWEVISEIVKKYQPIEVESRLVTTAKEDEIENIIISIIRGAEKELCIMGRALDETIPLHLITTASDQGADVKILLVPLQRLKEEKHPEISRLGAAVNKLSQALQVRTNINQHARIILSEKGALIGSTDPDYYGLRMHKNASIYTTDSTIVKAAKLFFCEVWDESEPYKPRQT